jgi:hypothetical protein
MLRSVGVRVVLYQTFKDFGSLAFISGWPSIFWEPVVKIATRYHFPFLFAISGTATVLFGWITKTHEEPD